MSYTSGRTVKSRAKTQSTTVASASADARKLIARHLGCNIGVTVSSKMVADPKTLAPQVRTVITYPGVVTDAHVALVMALTSLPGHVGACSDTNTIVTVRTA